MSKSRGHHGNNQGKNRLSSKRLAGKAIGNPKRPPAPELYIIESKRKGEARMATVTFGYMNKLRRRLWAAKYPEAPVRTMADMTPEEIAAIYERNNTCPAK